MKTIMGIKVGALTDEQLLAGAKELETQLETHLPGMTLSIAVLNELIERYSELRFRMEQLEK